ncbi:MAG: hypothetical protein M0R17_05970 [Candidatus Omnitrophica bacterium]|jgi:hypothetical protein|nr:hypothetical protein [Candidatus Omnitrophota bacterium]
MTEIDWFEYTKWQKVFFVSIVLSGLLGWILFGIIGCLSFLILNLGTVLIWWAMK